MAERFAACCALSQAETLAGLQLRGPIANVVQLVAFGTCNLEGRPMKAMVVKPFAHRLEQGHPALMFAAVSLQVCCQASAA